MAHVKELIIKLSSNSLVTKTYLSFCKSISNLCAVLRILGADPGSQTRDPNFFQPVSEFFPPRFPDPGSASKNLSILTQKIVSKLPEIWSGLFIPDSDPEFLSIPDPGTRCQKGTGSRHTACALRHLRYIPNDCEPQLGQANYWISAITCLPRRNVCLRLTGVERLCLSSVPPSPAASRNTGWRRLISDSCSMPCSATTVRSHYYMDGTYSYVVTTAGLQLVSVVDPEPDSEYS